MRSFLVVFALDFNPRSPCGERLFAILNAGYPILISIHAPRAGSDCPQIGHAGRRSHFNPRSPCGERPGSSTTRPTPTRFQSTLPVRGATRERVWQFPRELLISIHAPRAGSDHDILDDHADETDFNPRSPCGERPSGIRPFPRHRDFNPRSPCGERPSGIRPFPRHRDFNPRSPCGERPVARSLRVQPMGFQSTLPVRGATSVAGDLCAGGIISIHAPRAGSDSYTYDPIENYDHFNPRSPCGERLSRLIV